MLRRFDDFHVFAVGRAAGDAKSGIGQRLFVLAVELVTVPVPLADFGGAVSAECGGISLDLARPRAQPHRAAHFVHAQQFAQLVNDAVRRLRIELRCCPLRQVAETLRAYSIVAHCMPRQMPKNGILWLRAYSIAWIIP